MHEVMIIDLHVASSTIDLVENVTFIAPALSRESVASGLLDV